MNIITIIKQVPDMSQLSGTMNGLQLIGDNGPRIINPWDEYALETALQLVEAHGGTTTVLGQGNPDATEALRRGLAMGADEAVLISDPQLAHADSLVTARILAAAIQKIGNVDLITAGREAIDTNAGATAVQVAALLNLPMLSYVAAITAINPAAKTITVERVIEAGRETVTCKLPAIISVVKEINEPRYPNLIRIRKAAKVDIPVWTIADLGQSGAVEAQTKWAEIKLPPSREVGTEFIEGSAQEAAKTLVDRLLAESII
jgi:electron transfer flavoprotein beta subunit